MDELLGIAAALSDPTRVRLLVACRDGERCVCELTALVDLSASTVSKHLAILKRAGLLQSRKEGRWMHYGVRRRGSALARDCMELVFTQIPRSAQLRRDAKRMERIRAIGRERLCRAQRCGAQECAPPSGAGVPTSGAGVPTSGAGVPTSGAGVPPATPPSAQGRGARTCAPPRADRSRSREVAP